MISVKEFRYWEDDPVTKAVFKTLVDIRDRSKAILSDSDFLMSNEHKRITHLVGMIDGLEMVLDINVDDLESENTNDENNPMWAQSVSEIATSGAH